MGERSDANSALRDFKQNSDDRLVVFLLLLATDTSNHPQRS